MTFPNSNTNNSLTFQERIGDYSASFKAYDVRGRFPKELDCTLAYRIGLAFAQVVKPKCVSVGMDARLSGPKLCAALSLGLKSKGVTVKDIGLCGTEEIYFLTGSEQLGGGLMITASHNPQEYNGIKMVGPKAVPLTKAQFAEIKKIALDPKLFANYREDINICSNDNLWKEADITNSDSLPSIKVTDIHKRYAASLMQAICTSSFPKSKFKVVLNPGNGTAGLVLKELISLLPKNIEVVQINNEPDGNFPNGVPNPLLPERRLDTKTAVIEHKANLGVAWDGDFDRCFFFDEKGEFVEGYYLVGLFAKRFLMNNSSNSNSNNNSNNNTQPVIVHDGRLVWNTKEIVEENGGKAVMSPAGHIFIKEAMRANNAVYGGEMSAHHYFRDFFFCDCGMLPFLYIIELLGSLNIPLSQAVREMENKYPISGEINRPISVKASEKIDEIRQQLLKKYGSALSEDLSDGLSLEYSDFRINVRPSNTEPLLRLNVESKNKVKLMEEVRDFVLGLMC